MKLTRLDMELLRDFETFFKFIPTWDFNESLFLPYPMIADFTGNQRGKTAQKARQYVMRILGWHPVPQKNATYFECPDYLTHGWVTHDFGDGVHENIYREGTYAPVSLPVDGRCEYCKKQLRLHERGSRVYRFCSQTLPGDTETVGDDGTGQSSEVGNVVYPEFKKWLPNRYIRRDLTSRRFAMTIADPLAGLKVGAYTYKGEDIIIEFVSYGQRMQRQAGVQRLSVWEDEEPPAEFHEEQPPRVISENGDIIMTLTPAQKMSWTYDEIFEQAQIFLRTDSIVEYMKKQGEKKVKKIQRTESDKRIAIVQASTYDNPLFTKQQVNEHYFYDDPDVLATRCYGIHRQISGRVFPGFDRRVHVIDPARWIK